PSTAARARPPSGTHTAARSPSRTPGPRRTAARRSPPSPPDPTDLPEEPSMAATLRGLEGKNVLITGAAKGQGFSHAKAFADAGADIAALDITEPIVDIYPLATAQMMTETVAAIEDRDGRVIPRPATSATRVRS